MKQWVRKLKTPFVTADIIIRRNQGIVLVERKNEPHGWALPGGFVEVGESLENAASREAEEETSLEIELVEQFHAYSEPDRDVRFHSVTVVFIADAGAGILKARDDAKKVKIFSEMTLPDHIAFDHRQIITDYFNYIKTGKRPSIYPG
jgi:ADP-ribose pyrophosphatase YjhB (NUDIX family)